MSISLDDRFRMDSRLVYVALALIVGSVAHGQNIKEPESDDCAAAQQEYYSMPWHIGGIFIIFGASGVGIFTTLTLGTKAQQPTFERVLQIFKMFGIGVIAATGWCHLIPDAFEKFTSECLPEGWKNYGGAFVGVFALAASFAVQSIELVAGGGHSHGIPSSSQIVDGQSPPSNILQVPVADPVSVAKGNGHAALELETESHQRSQALSTIILEAGILFHSIIIGLTLGVTGNSDVFQTLLIAVCFHQFSEGLALGALISKLNRNALFKFLVMGLLYPVTTPAGMAIGIGIRSNYNENAQGAILTEGIFNSLSAGILLYNTYTELLSTEVNHNRTFKSFSAPYKTVNMLALYLGATSMAILAYWA